MVNCKLLLYYFTIGRNAFYRSKSVISRHGQPDHAFAPDGEWRSLSHFFNNSQSAFIDVNFHYILPLIYCPSFYPAGKNSGK